MDNEVPSAEQVAEYRRYFDSIYIAGIPRLLNDDGAFLSFIAVVTGIEALAGLAAPEKGTGARFRSFVTSYLPAEYEPYADRLWKLRNAVIHSFHPGPLALTHHASWAHLRPQGETIVLNAEDFYAALVFGSRRYFDALEASVELQRAFGKRVASTDGGAPQVLVATPTGGLPPNTALERSRDR